MKKSFFALVFTDILLAIFIYLWRGEVWLINSQIAFISSSFIMFSSMYSYQSMVSKALISGAVADDGRDTLDKLEDPYGLYDDEIASKNKEKTLEEVVKEERDNVKKGSKSIWETTKDAKASVSVYRLTAYGLLVLGFFYLNSNQCLELIPYLLSLSIPPIVIVLGLMKNR